MNYKYGDKVKIYSYDELKQKIENGLKFKSDKYSTSLRNENIFCVLKGTINEMNESGVKINHLYSQGCYNIEFHGMNFFIPEEFIKPSGFRLPDDLFKI